MTGDPTRGELERIGDRLQSEASRMAEWVLNDQRAPYEVMGAAAGAMSAVHEWTEVRTASDDSASEVGDEARVRQLEEALTTVIYEVGLELPNIAARQAGGARIAERIESDLDQARAALNHPASDPVPDGEEAREGCTCGHNVEGGWHREDCVYGPASHTPKEER